MYNPTNTHIIISNTSSLMIMKREGIEMKKIILILTLLFLVIGVAYAANYNELFKAPSGLEPMGHNDFVDKQGHNIMIDEYNDENAKTWFENDTGYLVTPYEQNNSFYLGADDDSSYILEVVEKDGVKYIIGAWTPKDTSNDAKVIWEKLQEFNALNNLKPIEV